MMSEAAVTGTGESWDETVIRVLKANAVKL